MVVVLVAEEVDYNLSFDADFPLINIMNSELNYEITLVLDVLSKAWSRETSYNPETWSEDNPALGQCAVSCILLKRIYPELDIVRTKAYSKIDGKEVSPHYYLEDPTTRKILDPTGSQYTTPVFYLGGHTEVSVDMEMLSIGDYLKLNLNTQGRYLTLMTNFILKFKEVTGRDFEFPKSN